MVDHSFVKCNFCKTNIFLRFQMGYFDIPFDFCCPECKVHIHGIKKIINENVLKINNATELEEDLDNIDYYGDFSVELPHKKITKFKSIEQIASDGFSPFMNMVSVFESGKDYFELVESMSRFLAFREQTWNRMEPLYDLYFNDKIDLIRKPVLQIYSEYTVENKLDVAMALHQLTIIGFNKILDKNALKEFMEVSEKIMNKEKFLKVIEFIDFLKNNKEFDADLKRIVKIYSRWIKNFEKYIPMVVIALGGKIENLNKETYGISTTSFEDMKSFYSDSYEVILDMITIAIGLNNSYLRGNYDSFSDKGNVGNFQAYIKQTKSERIKSLIEEEPFSKCIKMDRNVRNAIAHYDYEFDASSQKIIFYDKHRGKENTVELYLCELALLCYDNITILIYLNELFYGLRKIDFMKMGMCPHIGYPSK